MPINSINTNVSALVALQYLNATNREMDNAQNRVSTGLKVINAIDDASSFAIAQGLRADLKGYAAISQGIANGKGVGEIALAGLTSISDLLGDIQGKITATSNVASTDIYTTGAVPAGLNNTLSAVTLAGVDITAEIRDGRVGGYLELRGTRLTAAGTTGMQAVIDSLAGAMTMAFFNPAIPVATTRQLQLFQDTSGQYDSITTPSQQRGYAGRILVNPVVIANPWRTRDGTVVAAEETNDRGDATIPLGIVDLFENTPAFTTGIANGVNALIGQVIEVRERAEYQDNVTNALDQRRKNQSGVNTDQELALMIQLQNSYNASARIIQTVQEMYDSLFRISP